MIGNTPLEADAHYRGEAPGSSDGGESQKTLPERMMANPMFPEKVRPQLYVFEDVRELSETCEAS